MKKFVAMALFALVGLTTVQSASAWLGWGNYGYSRGYGYGNCGCNTCGSYYTYNNCGCNSCGYGTNWY